jgi:hypothetical protein
MIDTKCMYNFQVNKLPVSLMKIMCTELSQIDTPGRDIGSAVFMMCVLVQSGMLSCDSTVNTD